MYQLIAQVMAFALGFCGTSIVRHTLGMKDYNVFMACLFISMNLYLIKRRRDNVG